MYWNALDKIDSNLYKGIAILMIVMHNFMHRFPIPSENEFDFSPEKFLDFLHIASTQPESFIRISLSFFGHFGVQIFTFLSAYGLTKKYLRRKPDYWIFIWQRAIKIYPAFLLAICAWLAFKGWGTQPFDLLGPVKLLASSITPLILKLSLLANFIPSAYFSPVGPWWFIPFIFQFYLIFPLLRHLFNRYGSEALLFLSISGMLFSMLNQGKIGNLNIYFTVLGHLPEFCLGIYLANKDSAPIRVSKLIILLALIIFILGNLYEPLWHANHISFLILLLAGFSAITKNIKNTKKLKQTLLFFGSISMPLFLVNGFLRKPFFDLANSYNYWLLTIALCLLSLAFSTVVALVVGKMESYIMSRIDTKSPASLYKQIRALTWPT